MNSPSQPPPPGYRKPDRGTQPDYYYPPYASTTKRSPSHPLVLLPTSLSEVTGPMFGYDVLKANDHDLTKQHSGDPIGERIVVSGRVLDANARPVANTLIEIWQANAAGRYPHRRDNHNAPMDPNFTGCGRTITDAEGRYRFVTIRPGEYPWRNHYNAWRPAHIHFSLFGAAFACQISISVLGMGRPSSSTTMPVTMMRSPSGSPLCWRVRSVSFAVTGSCPYIGPVSSDSVCGMTISGRLGDRRIVEA
jgi:protocatechuate 3,4-dioxygenase beta subunit